MDERARAREQLLAATPAGWFVGWPGYHEARRGVELYAFDPSERARAGVRQREWEAVGDSELAVVHEMARCLSLIKAGKVPK